MAQTTGIAIGENASASSVNSIAIGDNTTAAAGHVALNTWDTMDAQGNIIPARLGAVTGGLSFLSSSATTADIIAAYNAMLTAMGKSLPYDSAIEYLEGTGTQYVDTGFVADQNTTMELDFGNLDLSSSTNFRIAGARAGATSNAFWIGKDSVSSQGLWGFGQAYSGYGKYPFPSDGSRKTYTLGAGKFLVDGLELWTTAYSAFTSYEITIFTFNQAGVKSNCAKLRLYAAKINSSSSPVRDFVPVRVGQVGYLYDRVSGQLFGNAGTGSFVLGPDV